MTIRQEQKVFFNPANIVTLFRIFLLFSLALFLSFEIQWIKIVALILIPIIFFMDSLDGFLARKLKCATPVGGILDVAGDRIVEIVLWMLLALFNVLPVWVPVLVIVRGFLTDGFRNGVLAKGHTTFSMMKSKLGWWIVASPLSRTSSAIAKAIVFTFGIAINAFQLGDHVLVLTIFYSLVTFTLFQSLIRAFFTIKESAKIIRT
jgi:CDP-diacylglycerol---glycerol-3-phosphate 3-phosphatidyltransferase